MASIQKLKSLLEVKQDLKVYLDYISFEDLGDNAKKREQLNTLLTRIEIEIWEQVQEISGLQTKFTNYSFIPLTTSEFLDYEGAELLLIGHHQEILANREKELETCLEKIHPDNPLKEFAKINSPALLTPIKE